MRFTDDDTQRRFTAEGYNEAELLELRFQSAIASKTGAFGYFAVGECGVVDWIETRTCSADQQLKVTDMLNNHLDIQKLRAKI